MLAQARTKDVEQSIYPKFTVPNLRESVCENLSEPPTCIYQFYTSCGGKLLCLIFTLIGFQCAYECIWSSQGLRMILRLKKNVSMTQDFRVKYMEEDYSAAETTFRIENVPQPAGWFWWSTSQLHESLLEGPTNSQVSSPQPFNPAIPPNYQQNNPGFPPNYQQNNPAFPPNYQQDTPAISPSFIHLDDQSNHYIDYH